MLKRAFNILVSLFERIGLKNNTKKTEVIVFFPGNIRICLLEEVYCARMNKESREAWD